MNTPMPGELPKFAPTPVDDEDEFAGDNELSDESAAASQEAGGKSGPFSGMGGGDAGGAGQK